MFDDLPGSIWLDGKIVSWKDARIHVMTHALHYASSVYEGLRAYGGKLLKAHQHYERFHQSANYLDFEVPYAIEELIEATEFLIKQGNYDQGYIRAIAWCGSKKMTVSHNGANVHVAIAVWERPVNYTESQFKNGIRMNISNWYRPDPKTAPVHSKASGLYMISSMSKRSSELLGFDDALMLDYRGNIAEASSSNIFLVIDGELFTPKPECFLNGITRRTCLDIARDLNINVYETKLTLDDLDRAQEVFLTGTAIEILSVGSIEGNGKSWQFRPAGVTNAIYNEFRNIIDKL
ncbi:MAG: branched-chain amino acid transaminase [Candidatus Midichloria sp.]|nr:branched-chain amino acid transaminase [Candidatus Midichloria sp.]